MPIYEFYCKDCNMIFNFFSKRIDTDKKPLCPKCKTAVLDRWMSSFAFTGKAKEDGDMEDMDFDEGKMEKAMRMLEGEVDKISEDDPRQAADLMRKLTHMTGMELGAGMEEALSRMEKGEDPEQIEAEMGDIIEGEDPFVFPGKKIMSTARKNQAPVKDETLYEL